MRGNKVYEDGKINFSDLSEEVPFPSVNVVVSLTGAALSAAVATSRAPWREEGGALVLPRNRGAP